MYTYNIFIYTINLSIISLLSSQYSCECLVNNVKALSEYKMNKQLILCLKFNYFMLLLLPSIY